MKREGVTERRLRLAREAAPGGRWRPAMTVTTHRAVSRVTAHLTAHLAPWSTILHPVAPYPLQYHQQLTYFQHPTRACPEPVEGGPCASCRRHGRLLLPG